MSAALVSRVDRHCGKLRTTANASQQRWWEACRRCIKHLRSLRNKKAGPFFGPIFTQPPKSTNRGTETPDVRAPEGSRVSEVSDEGACVSGCHRILLKHSLWFIKHNGVMKTPELCLLCAYYLRLEARGLCRKWVLLASSRPSPS